MLIDPYTWHTVKITSMATEARDAVSIATTRPAHYEFRPGQHCIVRVTLPDNTLYIRQYSFSGIPQDNTLSFTVIRSPQGVVSNWCIDTAKPGMHIDISQPLNGPLAVDGYPKNIGLIAGGSGIAAIISHVRALRVIDHPFALCYISRTATVCYRDELSAKAGEDIVYYPTDKDGRPDPQAVFAGLSECSELLLCGSRPFVTAMSEYASHYAPGATVRAEAFNL